MLLAGAMTLAGCASFMAPAKVTPLFTAAERDAFYSLVNRGVATTAGGLTLLYLVARIADNLPSETEMRESWIPRGVRAFVEDRYVGSADEREDWRLTGKVSYIAMFAPNHDTRLFRPAADLAYFCHTAGGRFQLHAQDQTAFTDHLSMVFRGGFNGWGGWSSTNTTSYSLSQKGPDGRWHGVAVERESGYARPAMIDVLTEAQARGAWGYFVCRMPDRKATWEAVLAPGKIPGPGPGGTTWNSWTVSVRIDVHQTPAEIIPQSAYQAAYDNLDGLLRDAYRSGQTVRLEREGVQFEAWPGSRFVGGLGCRRVAVSARYGDRVVGSRRQVLCPDDLKKPLPAS